MGREIQKQICAQDADVDIAEKSWPEHSGTRMKNTIALRIQVGNDAAIKSFAATAVARNSTRSILRNMFKGSMVQLRLEDDVQSPASRLRVRQDVSQESWVVRQGVRQGLFVHNV